MMSQASYLDLEASVSNVSEWICGQLVPRSELSKSGQWMQMDIGRAMPNGAGKFDVYSNVRVYNSKMGDFLYPQVVVCAKDALDYSQLTRTLVNPVLVVEIVTDTNFNLVHENKLASYLSIPTVQHCLLVSQDKVFVHHFARSQERWLASTYTKLNEKIELEILGSSLSLKKTYQHLGFFENDHL